MFRDTRRKTLRNRVILAALGVAVMTFGIWLNYRSQEPQQEPVEAAGEIAAEEKKASGQEESASSKEENVQGLDDAEPEDEAADDGGTDTESVPEAYLIKEMDGSVKVFLCHEDGSRELYLVTSIPFELLSESDQQLLRDGVRIKTEDDLGKFLESFDS